MKCAACGADNKDSAKACKKCAYDFTVPPAWFPDTAWHLKTLGVIYVSLILFYFAVSAVLSKLPKPYHLRKIPVEMTPWLAPGGKVHLPEEQLKPPPPLSEKAAAPAVK